MQQGEIQASGSKRHIELSVFIFAERNGNNVLEQV